MNKYKEEGVNEKGYIDQKRKIRRVFKEKVCKILVFNEQSKKGKSSL